MQRIKIGIMGGAFDPIHYGHLLIAENALFQYGLDEVWFMPSGRSPYQHKNTLLAADMRCEMINLAIQENQNFCLSVEEIQREGISYTYQTLENLKKKYPQKEFYFIIGGDSLKGFEEWKHPKRILNAAFLLAAVRDDIVGEEFKKQIEKLNHLYGAKRVYALNTPGVSFSSSQIRKLVSAGKTVRYMLPEEVRRYIDKHGLYQDE